MLDKALIVEFCQFQLSVPQYRQRGVSSPQSDRCASFPGVVEAICFQPVKTIARVSQNIREQPSPDSWVFADCNLQLLLVALQSHAVFLLHVAIYLSEHFRCVCHLPSESAHLSTLGDVAQLQCDSGLALVDIIKLQLKLQPVDEFLVLVCLHNFVVLLSVRSWVVHVH